MPLEIRVDNLQEIIKSYDGAQQVIEEEIDDAVSGVLGQMVQELAMYPPERANQQYIRTFQLQQGWLESDARFVIGAGGRIDSMVRNPTPYGGYVQDADNQASVHKGRWKTTQDITTEYEPDVQNALQVAFDAAQSRIEEV